MRKRCVGSWLSLVVASSVFVGFLLGGCGGSGGTGAGSEASTSSSSAASTSGTGGQPSGGTIEMTVTRDSAARQGTRIVPSNTASIQVSAVGTSFTQTFPFPSDLTTTTLLVTGVPIGVQVILVEALDGNGNVLAKAQVTVTVSPTIVASVNASLTPVSASPSPSPSPTPLNMLLAATIGSTSQALVGFDLNKNPVPTSPTLTVPFTFVPQSMVAMTVNNIPYLFMLCVTEATNIPHLLVIDPLTLTTLSDYQLSVAASIPVIRADPVHKVLYIAHIAPFSGNPFVEIIDVSGYNGTNVPLTGQVITLANLNAIAIDPGPTASFWVVATNTTTLQEYATFPAAASPVTSPILPSPVPVPTVAVAPSATTVLNIIPATGANDMDLGYVATTPIGLVSVPNGVNAGVTSFDPLAAGGTVPTTTLPPNFFTQIRFFESSSNNATALVCSVPSGSGAILTVSAAPGSNVPTINNVPLSGLPPNSFPSLIAVVNATASIPAEAFVADTTQVVSTFNGFIDVVDLPAATQVNSRIPLGASTSVGALTVFQQAFPTTR